MFATKGLKVLQERYELIEYLETDDNSQLSESWIAIDPFDNEFLVKLWPFQGETANEVQRALWDTQLRTMYRVGSSPGAEKSLLIIRDAGIDKIRGCFVMVMQSSGSSYVSLMKLLSTQRAQYPWLSNASAEERRKLWQGLHRIAQGLYLLHNQDMLHRNVEIDSVFLSPDLGPMSFRLSGFEWSVRLGELYLQDPPISWATPPEFSSIWDSGYQPENDWYGFGMLAARCLLSVEAYHKFSPIERHERVAKDIDRSTDKYLSDLERLILQRLIDRKRVDRLMRGSDIINAIDDLLHSLGRGGSADVTKSPLYLAYNPNNQSLIDRAIEVGFVPDMAKPNDPFNPNDIKHCVNLSSFIQSDLSNAQIYAKSNRNNYVLVGKHLQLLITRLEKRDQATREKLYTWDVAFCRDVTELRTNEGGNAYKDIPFGTIAVRTTTEIKKFIGMQQTNLQTWERYLPYIDEGEKLRANLAMFHGFIRITNQVELLMRDAELFQYEVVKRSFDSVEETLIIREVERSRPIVRYLRPEGGLLQFLQREIESNKPDCRLVLLASENQNSLRFESETKIEKKNCFQIVQIKQDENEVLLKRSALGDNLLSAPDKGWIRSYGLFGQMALIRRRKEAIDRLAEHSYLLRSLCATGQVYMNTGDLRLLNSLPSDKVDEAKQAVMKDILQTRPVYALQGPPGTGKTTMVAHLLRQIFDDDNVVQVLITAQAHGAVDVLRNKVRNEAFKDIEEEKHLPLAIRLRKLGEDEGPVEGSVEAESLRILKYSIRKLSQASSLIPIQEEWLAAANEMVAAINTFQKDQKTPEFCELVKQGANFTYCTTSAGGLEELARNTQSFDWAIIEEAGKCHGFDLALPLQAGHRWLLIGDQNQLFPYRIEDFKRALLDIDQTIDALRNLPNRGTGLVDFDLIERLEAMDSTEQQEFREFSLDWLKTFDRIFRNCASAPAGSDSHQKTTDKPVGAVAGMLSSQYRMHPTIGTLISHVYYNEEVVNKTTTEGGDIAEWVRLQVVTPEAIRDVGIVWIDTPSAVDSHIAREIGPKQNSARYTNPYEIKAIRGFLKNLCVEAVKTDPLKLAVLSPYSQQVSRINRELSSLELPVGIVPREELRTRQQSAGKLQLKLAHTVDSFQGNEADIVVVSLVRNNKGDTDHPLGFLEIPQRMNVLLSRAQRLLVLVGSWDFFCDQVAHFSIDDISRELWHLKKAVTMIEEWFKTGEAIKLNADMFVRETS